MLAKRKSVARYAGSFHETRFHPAEAGMLLISYRLRRPKYLIRAFRDAAEPWHAAIAGKIQYERVEHRGRHIRVPNEPLLMHAIEGVTDRRRCVNVSAAR